VVLRAIYGLPTSKSQRDLYRDLTGERFPTHGREYEEFVLVFGGQSGKTRLTAAIASYESTTRNWSEMMRPGEPAWCLVFATRQEQAIDIGRNMIFSMIRGSPILKDLVIDDPAEAAHYELPKTKRDILSLATGAAVKAMPCTARVGRGYPTFCAVFDEAGWYARVSQEDRRPGKNATSDQEVYDSVLPRMAKFSNLGKRGVISTPTDESGLVWTRWKDRILSRDLYLCIRIPTWKMRTDFSRDFFDRARRLSPLSYAQEFGAEFTAAGKRLFDRAAILKACRADAVPIPYDPKHLYYMAFDSAFGDRDRFAVAVGHLVQGESGFQKHIVDIVEIVTPGVNEDLVDAGVRRVLTLYKEYHIPTAWCDVHQADAFGKLLDMRGVAFEVAETTAATKRLKYGRLANLLYRNMLSLPRSDDLIEELVGLDRRFLAASGQYTVSHRPGGHDDLADATAEIIYRMTEDAAIGVPTVEFSG